MAIPFLNNIDLSDNELRNAKLHIVNPAPTAATGQIYLDSSDNIAKYYSNGTDTWVSLKEYNFSSGTFVNLSTSGTTAKPIITADLSATGTPDATVYLRGDNTWSPISTIPGTYTFTVEGDTGGLQTVSSGSTLELFGGTYISTNSYSGVGVTFNHDNTSRTDTTSTDAPGFGATFTAVTSVTTNATGHITAIDTSTVTVPGGGTMPDDITFDGVITAEGGLVMQNNPITDVGDPTNAQDAATKAYVDSAVVGGLVYQGGYNAATNTPDLDSSPSASIKKGWTYTVTADGLFFTEQVRVGDVIIAEVDSPTTLADWTTVQNNIDIASASQVGIGNVVASTNDTLLGIDVTYNGSGTAAVGLDIGGLTNVAELEEPTYTYIPYFDDANGINGRASIPTIGKQINTYNSYATTISNTTTITHGLTTKDVIIQLYDTVTLETVYADVVRVNTLPYNTATITFATTPTNPIRVLVQKIG